MNKAVTASAIPVAIAPGKPTRKWRSLKIIALIVGLVPIVMYAAVIEYYIRMEPSLVYMPSRMFRPERPGLNLPVQKVSFVAQDGVRLAGLIIPAKDPSAPWVYFMHGNNGNETTCQPWWLFVHELPANLLVLDYRGYGQSGGMPSERGFYMDAKAGYDYLVQRRGVSPSRLFLYGHSLGTAVAIDLATHVSAAGLILEGALISIPVRGEELYPFLPVALIAHNHFDSSQKIQHVSCPKLFMHARNDTVIPIHHGQDLFNWAKPPKTFVELKAGDHNNAIEASAAQALAAVREFIRENSGQTDRASR